MLQVVRPHCYIVLNAESYCDFDGMGHAKNRLKNLGNNQNRKKRFGNYKLMPLQTYSV